MKILVVDDDEFARSTFGAILARDHHDVTLLPGAETALDELAEATFDVVICDLKMPGISGLELHEKIAREHPEVPVILTTGYITPAEEPLIARTGAQLLTKPFGPSEVRAVLKKVLLQGS